MAKHFLKKISFQNKNTNIAKNALKTQFTKKRKNMRYTSILVFILLSISTLAQNVVLNRNIHWNEPISKENSINGKGKILNFSYSVYNGNNSDIPYFIETVDLQLINMQNAEAVISNPVYESLSVAEKDLITLKDLENDIIHLQAVYIQQKKPILQVTVFPFRKNPTNGTVEKLVNFSIEIIEKPQVRTTTTVTDFAENSVLASGKWIKIRIEEDGFYKLTNSELQALGIENPQNVRVFGYGGGILPEAVSAPRHDDLIENKIIKTEDGILFYAKGTLKWEYNAHKEMFLHTQHFYSDASYYFLTSDVNGANNEITIAQTITLSPHETVTAFTEKIYHELEDTNLVISGRQWFGEFFDLKTDYDFTFDVPNLVQGATHKIFVEVAARSNPSSNFVVTVGNISKTIDVEIVTYSDYTGFYAHTENMQADFTTSNNLNVHVKFQKNNALAKGWLDKIIINAQRNLFLSNGQLHFNYINSSDDKKVIDFVLSNANSTTRVFNVSADGNPIELNGNLNGNTLTVRTEVEAGVSYFIAIDGVTFLAPIVTGEDVGVVENQNLHSTTDVDYVIVTHPDFLQQAEQLAQIHRDIDNMNVLVVEAQKIYNEFSSGAPDATAIRDFMLMLYQRAGETDNYPKYLALFGDGSYDNRGYSASPSMNTNYLPTFQWISSISGASFSTDDYFGLLDTNELVTNGLLDIGIGRFPVKNTKEAQNVIDKIKAYISPSALGDWQHQISFVADDADLNQTMHTTQANDLANYIDTNFRHYNIEKLYMLGFPQMSTAGGQKYPAVTQAINNRMFRGAFLVNYTGHGNEEGWAHEGILSITDINSWQNIPKLPIFITGTCEFSRYDDFRRTSAGEMVFLNPKGGGITMFTTTRLVYSGANFALNQNLLRYMLPLISPEEPYRMGDVIRLAKVANGATDSNKLNFILFGDPALKIHLAKYEAVTETINGVDVSQPFDTLAAYRKITVTGSIRDNNNNILTNYNGTIYPSVFDKYSKMITLPNDDVPIFEFDVQNNVIYRGKSSVENGLFTFSFIVPRDIAYNYGNGKISYYAENGVDIAKGSFEDIIVGGTDTLATVDRVEPEIKLYLNNTAFVSGSITSESPTIYALVEDESGINTVGNGIGHDITATIDGKSSSALVLNDFYEADKNSYQSGKVEYALSNIEEGAHSLTLKVWDVFNNSSEATIDFVVSSSASIKIEHLLNYPNPFTNQTAFYFEHNQANNNLEVMIQIFTISGILVKTIETQLTNNAFNSGPIAWDGTDDYGDKIGRGTYIYKVKVMNSLGETAEEFEKLVILK